MSSSPAKKKLLDKLYAPYIACTACPLGQLGRKNVVFGEGNSDARLLLIGEGPGAQEDMQARPFVGRSGQLLTKVLEAAGMRRDQVYIANIVKCRPPENRNPFPLESNTCINLLLLNQIAIIKPQVICLLGACAARSLLDEKIKISTIRGKVIKKGAISIIPTYHPAYILRNQSQLNLFFNDIKLAVNISTQI